MVQSTASANKRSTTEVPMSSITVKMILYSDAGHGFLFQHHQDFAHEVTEFLSK
jgi:hypothetical protein